MIINGSGIAKRIIGELAVRKKPPSFFGAVLVGDDSASLHFLKQKERVARELGVEFRLYELPESITTDQLREEIGRLAGPKRCGGFIVQLPLPERLNKHYALNAIPKQKDVDFLSEAALGSFYTGRSAILPPSVGTVEEILKACGTRAETLRGLKAAVIGSGLLVGKPVGFWLQNRVAELVVLDSKTQDLPSRLIGADVVISGAGSPNLFGAKHLKENALVIDFGFNKGETGIAGDFNPEGAESRGVAYTKTPGGTGPILVAKLFENFYSLNRELL